VDDGRSVASAAAVMAGVDDMTLAREMVRWCSLSKKVAVRELLRTTVVIAT
jgi:hypothetical protein